jgi:colanic acid biosynthesis glycosyl transferase WcaI
MAEIARGLRDRGHAVSVLTSMPHYNPSPAVLKNRRYRPRFPRLFTDSTENGVRVLRVWMPLKGRRVLRRAIEYLWFHSFAPLVALAKLPRQDVVFVTSPPITLGLAGWALATCLRARLIYDVRELWPDVPFRMGLIRSRLAVRFLTSIEQFVYRRSSLITSIARSFERSLISRGVPATKLRFTPNFIDADWLRPGDKDNEFSREQGLRDRFVVLYAGNIGLTQGLEILVDAARALLTIPELQFLVIGDGAGRERFAGALGHAKLPNFRLLPFQPYSRVPETYAAADVCVSPMLKGYSYDTIPSKIYTALAAGRPVIAAAEPDTETAELLRESGSGIVIPPESPSDLVGAIRRLHDEPDLRQAMSRRGREWVMRFYTRDEVIGTYDRAIRETCHKDE